VSHAADRLIERVRNLGNAVVVGIDPRPSRFPSGWRGQFPGGLAGEAEAVRTFGMEVIDAVADRVPAVKFQSAFYETYGPDGLSALRANAAEAKRRGLFVILDGKRNDIGSTAEAYASAYLGRVTTGDDEVRPWPTDALTVNPYLGWDGIQPFATVADREGTGLFVLVRTSKPSSGDFQDLEAGGKPLYRHVADRLAEWASPYRGGSGYSLVGAVVGATYPDQLKELRDALPGILLLIPGYGAQGGTAADVASGFDAEGLGALVNSSRGIIFAHDRPEIRSRCGDDWKAAISLATDEVIADLAAHTPMGRLRP